MFSLNLVATKVKLFYNILTHRDKKKAFPSGQGLDSPFLGVNPFELSPAETDAVVEASTFVIPMNTKEN